MADPEMKSIRNILEDWERTSWNGEVWVRDGDLELTPEDVKLFDLLEKNRDAFVADDWNSWNSDDWNDWNDWKDWNDWNDWNDWDWDSDEDMQIAVGRNATQKICLAFVILIVICFILLFISIIFEELF
ncbi:hypothetical protein ACH5RR_023592 [Cinchona calisaya]|uniref:Transmembrane protein n=1 Tax=Cinchona calisaya TaxID=153742 RepID=A0ABD2ZB25_9GENT